MGFILLKFGLNFVVFVTAIFVVKKIPGARNKMVRSQNKHVRQSVTQ
jgi:hypothetical protein